MSNSKVCFPHLAFLLRRRSKIQKVTFLCFQSVCIFGDGWRWWWAKKKKKKWSHLQHFLHLTAFLPDSKLRISVLLYYVFKEPPHIYCLPKGRPEWHFLCIFFLLNCDVRIINAVVGVCVCFISQGILYFNGFPLQHCR